MLKPLSKLPELRILAYLAIIALAYHLFTIFSSFLNFFADIFLLIFLSWILAFLIEPLVLYLAKKGFSHGTAAVFVYILLAISTVAFFWIIIPTSIAQLSQLSGILPSYIPSNSIWSTRLESFISSTLSNSVNLASQVASALTGLILAFILSFYFLLSRKEISKFILQIIPDDYEDDYLFFESTLNTTFASFIRVQLLLGLLMGFITFFTLSILRVDFALTTALISAVLAMVPIVGTVLFLIPPALAAFIASPQKFLITLAVLILAAQLVFNIYAPRLIGKVLKIHPIVVLLSFLVGYKTGGFWGAIFAVPVTSALAIIGKDLMKYWKQEADKK